jgi:serine/threonine protein kinase
MSNTKSCPFCSEEILINAIKCKHCSSALQDAMSSSLYADTPVRLALGDKYEILEIIGRGGMATVYKANQKNLNRLVAIKVVYPNLIHDTEFLNRFHREAQMAASLNHPNIVMIYDEGSLNGVHFIAMEYLEGKDLHCILKEKGKLSVDETINIIKPIAEALDFAHSKGLIHRDVKSANILVTDNGRPVLTDFGIAHAASGTKLTQAGSVIGTPEYMSPEQAEGKDLDGRSDIFSLGIVMYECLTGKVPFKGDNPLTTIYGIINDSTPSLKSFNSKIPGWLDAIVMCSLAKTPNERFPTGRILSEYLIERKTPSGSFKKLQGKTIKNKQERQYTQSAGKNSSKTLIGLIVLFAIIIITATFLYFKQEKNVGNLISGKNESNQRSSDGAVIPAQDITLLMNEASILFNDNKLEEARLKYKEAQDLQPDSQEVKERMKEIDDNISKKNEIQKLMASADKLFEKNDLSKSRIEYLKILEFAKIPENAKIPGIIKQSEKAKNQIANIDQKLKANANQSEANFNRVRSKADSLFNIKHYESAKPLYENLLRIKPNDESIKDRKEENQTNLTLNESQSEELLIKANIELKLVRYKAAKDLLIEAQKLLPGNQKIQNRLDSLNNIIQTRKQTEIDINMVLVQGGSFEMGNATSADDQRPVRLVTLSSFNIDKYEVSVKQYKLFCDVTGRGMPPAPTWELKDNEPIVNVTYEDAIAFAKWAGKRLPTEAEWEYAALGGAKTKGYKYSGSDNAGSVATYAYNKAVLKPKSVESNSPNELGIYNMSGNVWEWCSDFYDEKYYGYANNQDNPKGPEKGKFRVIRGGAWNSPTKEIMIRNRASQDGKYLNCVGFRCVKE